MERSLQGLPPITKSKGPHSCICNIWRFNSQMQEEDASGAVLASVTQAKGSLPIKAPRTCFWVTLRTSPTYMILPWCRTIPTVIESSHTSDAMYRSTWMPKSFSTRSPGKQKPRCYYRSHVAFTLPLLSDIRRVRTHLWQCHQKVTAPGWAFSFQQGLEGKPLVDPAKSKVAA